MKKPTFRTDWINGANRVFITDAAGNTIDIRLEDFVRIADKLLTGTIEEGNDAHRSSFRKLPKIVRSLDP